MMREKGLRISGRSWIIFSVLVATIIISLVFVSGCTDILQSIRGYLPGTTTPQPTEETPTPDITEAPEESATEDTSDEYAQVTQAESSDGDEGQSLTPLDLKCSVEARRLATHECLYMLASFSSSCTDFWENEKAFSQCLGKDSPKFHKCSDPLFNELMEKCKVGKFTCCEDGKSYTTRLECETMCHRSLKCLGQCREE